MTVRTFLLAPLDPTRPGSAPTGASWLAVASGLVVGAPVARFFMSFEDQALIWGPLIGLVALTCTAVGSWAALGAEGRGTAVAWVFVGNVVPPTVLCAPTVFGVLISLPSGLLACVLVLPMVLWARALAGRDRDDPARMRLVAALFLALAALGVLVADAVAIEGKHHLAEWETPSRVPLALLAPGALLGALATLSALASFAPDVYRLWLRAQIRLGRLASLEHDRSTDSIAEVRSLGAGPLRSATTREPIARLDADLGRAALGAICVALGASAVAGSLLALVAR